MPAITDTGDASFSISGTAEGGNTLSISQDGRSRWNRNFKLQLANTINTTEGNRNSLVIQFHSDQGKKIRAVISYVDGRDNEEQITTATKNIFLILWDYGIREGMIY